MNDKLIDEIETRIRSESMTEACKNEVLQSLAKLRAEMTAAEAEHEKLKSLRSPVEELRSSVEGFEQSHPKLIQAVNNISSTLSNWGV